MRREKKKILPLRVLPRRAAKAGSSTSRKTTYASARRERENAIKAIREVPLKKKRKIVVSEKPVAEEPSDGVGDGGDVGDDSNDVVEETVAEEPSAGVGVSDGGDSSDGDGGEEPVGEEPSAGVGDGGGGVGDGDGDVDGGDGGEEPSAGVGDGEEEPNAGVGDGGDVGDGVGVGEGAGVGVGVGDGGDSVDAGEEPTSVFLKKDKQHIAHTLWTDYVSTSIFFCTSVL